MKKNLDFFYGKLLGMWDVSSLVWLVDWVVITFFWNMYCLDGQTVTQNK